MSNDRPLLDPIPKQDVTFYKLPDAHHGSAGFRSDGALAVVETFLREHL